MRNLSNCHPKLLADENLAHLGINVTMECHCGNLLVNCRHWCFADENSRWVQMSIQPCRQCHPACTVIKNLVSNLLASPSGGELPVSAFLYLRTKIYDNIIRVVEAGLGTRALK